MEEQQELWTVKKLSEYFQLSLQETYKLLSTNAIAHFRVGNSRGAIRIRASDVAAFLNSRRQGPIELPRPQRATPQKLKHIRLKK